MAKNWVDKQCLEVVWLSPEMVLEPVRVFFDGEIPLDPATEASNPTKAKKFYTEVDNGLTKSWDEPTYVNPPYGTVIKDWCHKIHEEAVKRPDRPILALLPCGSGRPGTKYWQNHIFCKELKAVCYIKGRLKFLRPNGEVVSNNTYPSHLLGFNVDVKKFFSTFKHLGKVISIEVLN